MISRQAWAVLLVGVCGCSRPVEPGGLAPATPMALPEQAPSSSPAQPSTLAKAHPTPAAAANSVSPKTADDDLKTEEREANPYSETVTLKLAVTPPVKALVAWGAKQVARLAPGGMESEISRPRGSGPVDLEIKAEGFMPYHTRLYADRSDRVSVRLFRIEEAPGIFGYKRSVEKKK